MRFFMKLLVTDVFIYVKRKRNFRNIVLLNLQTTSSLLILKRIRRNVENHLRINCLMQNYLIKLN